MPKKLSENDVKKSFEKDAVRVERERSASNVFTITVPRNTLNEKTEAWRDRTWDIFQSILQTTFGKENVVPVKGSRFDQGYFKVEAKAAALTFLNSRI